MRIGTVFILILLLSGCSQGIFVDPITSESGLAFMASRDIFGNVMEEVLGVAEERAAEQLPIMDCPSEPFESINEF